VTPEQIATQTGIPVKMVKAIAQVESGSKPDALRFEPHLFLAAVPGAAIPYTRGPTGAASHVAAETNRAAFVRAFAINPLEAVKASSWGAWQDMGSHLIAIAGPDPAHAVAAFDADPAGTSGSLFLHWVRMNPRILPPARALDFKGVAHAYNGCCSRGLDGCSGCDHYAGRLAAAYNRVSGSGMLSFFLTLGAAAAAWKWFH